MCTDEFTMDGISAKGMMPDQVAGPPGNRFAAATMRVSIASSHASVGLATVECFFCSFGS